MKRRSFLQTIFGVPLFGAAIPQAPAALAIPVAGLAMAPEIAASKYDDLILPGVQANRLALRFHGVSYDEADFGKAVAAALAKGRMQG